MKLRVPKWSTVITAVLVTIAAVGIGYAVKAYFSPYQTCLRNAEHERYGLLKAKSECARYLEEQ